MVIIGAYTCAQDGCMNGGNCTDNNQQCVCPPGWTGDTLYFRQHNCTLPSSLLLILAVIGLVALIPASISFLTVRKMAKTRTLRLLHWASLLFLFSAMQQVAWLVEGGFFLAACLCSLCLNLSACGWACDTVLLFALPVFSLEPNFTFRVTRWVKVSFLVIAACLIVVLSVMAAMSGDDVAFNRAAIANNCIIFSAELGFATVIVYLSRALLVASVGLDTPTRELLHSRIRRLRLGVVAVAVCQLPTVIGSIVFGIRGSVPYYWVIVMVQFLATMPCIWLATIGMLLAEKWRRPSKITLVSSSQSRHVCVL